MKGANTLVAARHETHDEHRFFGQTASEFTQRLQAALRDELAAQRRAGYVIYGLDESDRVYTVLPDGCRIDARPILDDTSATNAVR
jgi:hypothetical protein